MTDPAPVDVIIVAGGGLAREVIMQLRRSDRFRPYGILDDDPALTGTSIHGVPVLGAVSEVKAFPDAGLVVAAGRGRSRRAIVEQLADVGVGDDRYLTIIDPTVDVPESCTVGPGSIVLAGTVLTSDVRIGRHVVIMPNVTLTHDDVVDDFATLCAGVALAGGVRVGAGAYLGTNAAVRERVIIGPDATVGMSAAVLREVPAGETWVGVPAAPRRNGLRIMVALHHLELGGSQLNAVDFATELTRRGHRVLIFANHDGAVGPVADLVRRRGLELVLVEDDHVAVPPTAPYRGRVRRAMVRAARAFRPDLVHGYEWSMILDAAHGPGLRLGVPVLGTVYGMGVPRWLPRNAPVIVGTAELHEVARSYGLRSTLIVPPVDLDQDDPAVVDGASFRSECGAGPGGVLAAIVSRLEPDMKEEGIRRSIDAVVALDDPRLILAIVGTGPSAATLREHAEAANARLGRGAVIMVGVRTDPRPCYAGADLLLGMGGSALRGMAYAKPLVVLGTRGFARLCEPESAELFRRQGFYGVGLDQARPLAEELAGLIADPGRRRELGTWSRRMIMDEYGLRVATDRLEEACRDAVAAGPGDRFRAVLRTTLHRTAAELAGPGGRAVVGRLRATGLRARGRGG
ncbi:NeuD/PglB/VioB family sugar acetyltransferase [Microlunatus parietis]|uniref:Sugar O-acyltransferase (Sialic acid O-acetyltransferase NeuD family) n=1 Tax=Microlunatus parietis TaxID=682979 RepID=A0A7Y9IAC3_9ACTN|nr:NeuD/PglB/VioB family sugar acetyltransferase [Microlunatus parietis]NYE73015.1 sugar O-acyltransferase (sialic acid O-acetyltransferase NeuD family) [Microlunatus parietis]